MKKRRLAPLTAALLSCVLLLSACGSRSGGDSLSTPQEGEGVLSHFTTVDLDNTPVDASIFADYRLTMVNVWATYCRPCLSEMPELGELDKECASQGVRVVGIVSDALNRDGSVSKSQLATAKELVSNTRADYLHILPSADLNELLSQIDSVPTTFFVDSTGRQVGNAYLGAKSKAKWAEIIEDTLLEVKE